MEDLKSKLNQSALIGTFVKTPHPHIIEVLSLSGLSFVVLDAEHVPFDRGTLDICILASRASQLSCIVRIQDSQPSTILNAFDCGAQGILVPHVCTREQAEKLVKMSHYGEGGRGYAGSTRAANYATKPMSQHLENSLSNVVIAQIEDPIGVDSVNEIAAVDGIDALFIGQVDLAVAYDVKSVMDDKVVNASKAIILAAQAQKKPVGMFVATAESVEYWLKLGVTFFCIGSEHKMIIDGFKAQQEIINHSTNK